jgi:hypothetical protein
MMALGETCLSRQHRMARPIIKRSSTTLTATRKDRTSTKNDIATSAPVSISIWTEPDACFGGKPWRAAWADSSVSILKAHIPTLIPSNFVHYIFWHENARFLLDMQPANKLTDAGYVLCSASKLQYVFYNEDALSVQLNLTTAAGKLPALAVDTKKVYREINLGILESKTQRWKAPYRSDWAITIGDFDSRN